MGLLTARLDLSLKARTVHTEALPPEVLDAKASYILQIGSKQIFTQENMRYCDVS